MARMIELPVTMNALRRARIMQAEFEGLSQTGGSAYLSCGLHATLADPTSDRM